MKTYVLTTIIVLTSIASCHIFEAESTNDSDILASVGTKDLFLNELENVIHPAVNANDSAALASAFIDQWIRDQLLMQEASRFFSSDFEIEKLVDDYRDKLVKFNFENKIIEERFDTAISSTQMEEFYNTNKEQFILDQPIVRCIYANFDDETNDLNEFRRNFNSDDWASSISFIEQNAQDYRVDSDDWHTWTEIEQLGDPFSISRAKQLRTQEKKVDNSELFLKVIEFRDVNEISPLEFIVSRLKLMILHQRKQVIIENFKQELYNKAIDNNTIKIRHNAKT